MCDKDGSVRERKAPTCPAIFAKGRLRKRHFQDAARVFKNGQFGPSQKDAKTGNVEAFFYSCTSMQRTYHALFAACFFLLAAHASQAQTVFTIANFNVLTGPHTITSRDILNPEAFKGLTGQGGTVNVFDLRGAQVSADSTASFTPVTCSASIPGCANDMLNGASLVLKTPSTEGDAYAFYDLTSSGLAIRGGAGTYFDEDSQTDQTIETIFSPASRVFAFPLQVGTTWASEYDVNLGAGGQSFPVLHSRDEYTVRASGTMQTDFGTTNVLLIAQRSIEKGLFGIENPDTSYIYTFFSPTLSATIEMDADGTVTYGSIETIAEGTNTSVEPPSPVESARLLSVQPNPSRGQAQVTFTLDAASPVVLEVYDLLGRRVATLENGTLPAGPHTRAWSDAAPAGIYYVRLQTGGEVHTQSLTRLD